LGLEFAHKNVHAHFVVILRIGWLNRELSGQRVLRGQIEFPVIKSEVANRSGGAFQPSIPKTSS